MGTLYQFTCKPCGYQAEVSGGSDAGGTCCTQTYQCFDCKTLFDAVVAETILGGELKEVPPRCPRRKAHRIEEWAEGGLCPKCGAPMTMGDLMTLWD